MLKESNEPRHILDRSTTVPPDAQVRIGLAKPCPAIWNDSENARKPTNTRGSEP